MKRERILGIERLESRRLLSGVVGHAVWIAPFPTAAAVVPAVPTVNGPTLYAKAGVPFSGVVGFYASPVLDPPLKYSATVNWGDGGTSDATLSYGQYHGQYGYLISATHTFAKAGIYSVKTTLVEGPINPLMGLPTRLVEYIADKAIVVCSTGVPIIESVGKKFTADLGTFLTIAPGTNLSATINWGDGSSSQGTLTSIGVQGIDEIKFKVTGTHTYKTVGVYSIKIVVNLGSPIAANPVVVATIHSFAIVI